jgi:predicted ATPase
LCLARPELLEQRPTWAAGKPRAITTTLPPLTPEDARLVAEHLLGPQAPILVVDRVCDTAEGNPLYLEQLTAMLADQGLLANGRWVGSGDPDVEIPVTLQALLAARLDRLDPVPRLILERASVEGRRFRIAALRALAPEVSPDEVESAIPRSRGRVSCSRRTRPAVDGASRTRSSSRPRIEASLRSCGRICTKVSPTG